jgi:hypothetical protein
LIPLAYLTIYKVICIGLSNYVLFRKTAYVLFKTFANSAPTIPLATTKQPWRPTTTTSTASPPSSPPTSREVSSPNPNPTAMKTKRPACSD